MGMEQKSSYKQEYKVCDMVEGAAYDSRHEKASCGRTYIDQLVQVATRLWNILGKRFKQSERP